jgi:hypothetical protein
MKRVGFGVSWPARTSSLTFAAASDDVWLRNGCDVRMEKLYVAWGSTRIETRLGTPFLVTERDLGDPMAAPEPASIGFAAIGLLACSAASVRKLHKRAAHQSTQLASPLP